MDEDRKEQLKRLAEQAKEKHLDTVIENYVKFNISKNGTWTDKIMIVYNDYLATGEGMTIHVLIQIMHSLSIKDAPVSEGIENFKDYLVKYEEYEKLRDLFLPENRKEFYKRIRDMMFKAFPNDTYIAQFPNIIMNLTYYLESDDINNDKAIINNYVTSGAIKQLVRGGWGDLFYSSTFHVNYS